MGLVAFRQRKLNQMESTQKEEREVLEALNSMAETEEIKCGILREVRYS